MPDRSSEAGDVASSNDAETEFLLKEREGTVTVLIHFEATRERQLDFEASARDHVRTRREATGCLRAELLQDVDAPHCFTLVEVFESQSSIDDYYGSSAYQAWHAQVAPWLESYTGRDQRWLTGGPEAE